VVAVVALTGVIGGGGEAPPAEAGGGEAGIETVLTEYSRGPDRCDYLTDAFVERFGGRAACDNSFDYGPLRRSDFVIEDTQISGQSADSKVRYTTTGKRDRFEFDLVGGEWKISSLNGS